MNKAEQSAAHKALDAYAAAANKALEAYAAAAVPMKPKAAEAYDSALAAYNKAFDKTEAYMEPEPAPNGAA
jgi:hypothetical protein